MIITQYYNFEAPELCDAPDVSYLSVNWQDLDGILHDKADLGIDGKVLATQLPSMNYVTPTGDGSTVTVSFTEAATNIDIATGDTLAVMAGKLLKNIHSLQTATGNNATAINNIVNGTTKVGSASNADTVGGTGLASLALKSEIPTSLPANGGNADTVGGVGIQNIFPTINVMRTNLGNPSVVEMALINAQMTDKVRFYPAANITAEYTTNGTSWVNWALTDAQKQALVIGRNAGGINILPSWNKARITFLSASYVFLNYLYFFASAQGNALGVQIEKSYDGVTWVEHVPLTAKHGSWPGHYFIPHSEIAFMAGGTRGTHWKYVRINFVPQWNNSNNIVIYGIEWWGGYPSGSRDIFSWDWSRNVTFPAQITATQFNGTATNADTVDGYHLAGRTNWSGVTNNIVVGQLAWKNYGNNHTIFDASNGTTPSGTACSNSTPDAGWSPNFPVLMGWNGYNTYGVKVNCADWANSSGNVDGVSLSGLAESKITSGTNLNTITKSGMYRIDVAPNTPLGLAYGQLIVMHGGGDTITQIYGDYYTGKLYTRSGAIPELGGGGSWSQWKGITTSLGTAKEIWVGAEASRGSDANTLYFCY